MPVSLSRVRIAGFKSFADPVSIDILPGLTGIVGPNGCGKSNVVEAMRWAMGESSARSLRGGEMDDVIFAGSGARPSRNLAEVTLSLEDTRGLGPAPFHEAPDLQISRRIERGVGSTFRVNGREARARDVQTLFADMATGARASAMVSQGRVAAIIGASPAERRSLLEEAAGITGLHARRHEAELKLRAAEANLLRAEDVRLGIEGQLDGLRKQARQAARFRALAEAVRAAEGELLAVLHAAAVAARDAARAWLAATAGTVAETAGASMAATTRATLAQAALPGLREAEAEARASVERARAVRAAASAARARAAEAQAALTLRHAQATHDLAHAAARAAEDAATANRIEADGHRLGRDAEGADDHMRAADQRARSAAARLPAAETALTRATEAAAESLACHRVATEQARAAAERAQRAGAALARLSTGRARAEASVIPHGRRADAGQVRDAAHAALADARSAARGTERMLADAAAALRIARADASTADAARVRIAAACNGLAEALGSGAATGGPVVDLLRVPAGLEAAVGAALGDDLDSSLDAAAARHWLTLPDAPCGPSLADAVTAPPALLRALRAVTLSDRCDPATLAPGRSVVSRAGDVWRWDGHVTRAGAPTRAAIRLQQRNRMEALRAERARAEAAAAAAAVPRTAAEAAERAAIDADRRAREAVRAAETATERATATAAAIERDAGAGDGQLAAVLAQVPPAEAEATAARTALALATAMVAGLPDPSAAQAATARARAEVDAGRREDGSARAARDGLMRDAAGRIARARTIVREREDLAARTRDGAGRVADLRARVAEAAAALDDQRAAPERLAGAEAEAIEALERAEAAARRHGDARHVAETEAATGDRVARAAEAAASAAREATARAEGEAAAADHAWGSVAERVLERLGQSAALPTVAAHDAGAEERARRKLDRLSRERDGMGPVNQRAELEAEAAAVQAETIAREATELTHAIAKLRGSIGHINREGRERLARVFADIDRHFQALFGRMFQGGRAHLALVGSDDPLQAGLEIFAQPPGKKLATLSLLSGGEQALTALSLIFAVFRCNPAPVCVLDEVDAPLDDANVERLCGLLGDLVAETATRFLVVTHHPHTMARMDRLFGVTMQERGVSRLLSVDLALAAGFAERAVAAE